jgi:hypothetical protein
MESVTFELYVNPTKCPRGSAGGCIHVWLIVWLVWKIGVTDES